MGIFSGIIEYNVITPQPTPKPTAKPTTKPPSVAIPTPSTLMTPQPTVPMPVCNATMIMILKADYNSVTHTKKFAKRVVEAAVVSDAKQVDAEQVEVQVCSVGPGKGVIIHFGLRHSDPVVLAKAITKIKSTIIFCDPHTAECYSGAVSEDTSEDAGEDEIALTIITACTVFVIGSLVLILCRHFCINPAANQLDGDGIYEDGDEIEMDEDEIHPLLEEVSQ